jgi:hypothetical protein
MKKHLTAVTYKSSLSPQCRLWLPNYKPQSEQSQNELEWKQQKYGPIQKR